MRKRYKIKKKSCALCKPHKMGLAKRFKDKDLGSLQESEKIIQGILNREEDYYD